jgi:hypothetical protein
VLEPAGAVGLLLRGYASSNSVERESMTIMLVFVGGNPSGGCSSSASRCANVGVTT